jgi:hypothetical protein
MMPFLGEDELAQLTHPTRQAHAQRRFLDRIGVPYIVRPDGRPMVSRDVLRERFSQQPKQPSQAGGTAPNRQALLASMAARKGKKRGTSA